MVIQEELVYSLLPVGLFAGCLLGLLQLLVEIIFWSHGSRESKVAQLNATLRIDQKVRWFQISVEDVGRVYKVQSAKLVVQDDDNVILTELGLRYCVH